MATVLKREGGSIWSMVTVTSSLPVRTWTEGGKLETIVCLLRADLLSARATREKNRKMRLYRIEYFNPISPCQSTRRSFTDCLLHKGNCRVSSWNVPSMPHTLSIFHVLHSGQMVFVYRALTVRLPQRMRSKTKVTCSSIGCFEDRSGHRPYG